ncbi:FecR family protein [Cellulophaga lytica]|uniref:FecR family protein n=1 Tax=Cellulophaga lytica TaxID=979 RepID=UPI0032E3FBB9
MQQKKSTVLKKLIAKSSKQKTSAKEEKLLHTFFKKMYNQSVWDTNKMGNATFIKDDIRSKIVLKETKSTKTNIYKYAAIAVTILTLGGILLSTYKTNQPSFVTVNTGAAIDSVFLADGSTIYLAPGSSFSYPNTFTNTTREVNLIKGNAFFNIAKNPSKPFIINSGELVTKVLGTSFHIGLQKKESKVSVVTGKVQVNYKNNQQQLVSGQEAVATNNSLRKQKSSVLMTSNWYTKDLNLTEVSLKETLDLLEIKYNVKSAIKNEDVLALKITLFIKQNATLNEIVEQLNYITNLKLLYENEIITLKTN